MAENATEKRIVVPELVPPSGGCLHIVRVPVILDRPWQKAINAAGPQHPEIYNVRKVGKQYPPTGKGTVETEMILMNFGPNSGSWDKAIAWANQNRLKRTNPRQVFAVSEHKPQLHQEFGFDYMYVLATEECVFENDRDACGIWWSRFGREADLYWVDDCGCSNDWLAFLPPE